MGDSSATQKGCQGRSFEAALEEALRTPEAEGDRSTHRDSALSELSGCYPARAGLLLNLRAELRPECAPSLAVEAHEKGIVGAHRAEIEGRAIASRINDLELTPVSITVGPQTDFEAVFQSARAALVQGANVLQQWQKKLQLLPATPGRTLAQARIVEKWRTLRRHNFPLSQGGDFEARARLFARLDHAQGDSINEQEAEAARLLQAGAAEDGATRSLAANIAMSLEEHPGGYGQLLREPPSTDPQGSLGLVDLLPAPHFAEFLASSERALPELARNGLSPSQLRLAYERLSKLAPSKQRRMRRALGEFHMELALLFRSQSNAQSALIFLDGLQTNQHQEADVRLARALANGEPGAGESAGAPLTTIGIPNGVAAVRVFLNRNTLQSAELPAKDVERVAGTALPPYGLSRGEWACFDDRAADSATECSYFAWKAR